MSQYTLDITSLKNSIDALEKSIAVYGENSSGGDIDLKNTLRSGIIQNFETAYELCWKFMKRWLEINVAPDIVLGVTRREFYRIACENRLISNAGEWWDFHDARNRTSHVYSAKTAEDVFNAAVKFIAPAKKFAADLEKKI